MKLFINIMISLGLLFNIAIATAVTAESSPEPMYIIETSEGNITIQLDKGPEVTTQNFSNYVDEKFYDNTIFHRVIPNFMIQGGGFTSDMKQKVATAAAIKNEGPLCSPNKKGTLAMARTGDPDSATAQFFINNQDNKFLDFTAETMQGYGYCGFAHVVEGREIVDIISAAQTASVGPYQNVPVTPIVIKSIRKVEAPSSNAE